jgi:hypothetical protein
VSINHRPSKIIPRFLPAKLFVSAIASLRCSIAVSYLVTVFDAFAV